MKLKLTKCQALMAVMFVTVAPWLSGGRDQLAVLITLAALLIGVFLMLRLPRDPAPIGASRLALAAWSLVGWAALSMVWSVNRYQTVVWLIPLVTALVVFAIARQFYGRWKETRVLQNGYLVIAVAFAVYGFYLYLVGDYPRLTSSIYWANPAAAWLLPAVLWGAWYWAESAKRFYFVSGAITLAAFILTDSRSAFLTLGVVAIYVAVTLKRKAPFWRRLGLILVTAVLLTLALNYGRSHIYHHQTAVQGSRLADAARGESISRTDRFYYLKSALAIWRDHPVVGTGAGTYASVHPKYQYRVISAASNAHNFYLETLSELGLVGFGLAAWLILELWWGLWRGIKADRRFLPLAIAAVVLTIHLGLDIDAEYPAIILLVALLAGLSYRPEKVREPSQTLYPAVLLFALILIALPVKDLYQSQVWTDRGHVAQDNGDYQLAADDFGRAHTGVAYNPDTLTAEGINLYTLAKGGVDPKTNLELARNRALTATKLDPADAQHYLLLARALRQMGQVKQAEQAYKRAIELDPYNDPDYYNDLAELYLANKDTASAKTYLDKVLSLYSDEVVANRHTDVQIPRKISTALTIRASIYLTTTGQINLARADLVRAARLNKANLAAQELLNNIGH